MSRRRRTVISPLDGQRVEVCEHDINLRNTCTACRLAYPPRERRRISDMTDDELITSLADKVKYTLHVEQDDSPVRGNAMASGDDAVDKEVEDEILARLERGDIWAWAAVKVTASFLDFEGEDWLHGCSYKDEANFREPGGYFDDMKHEARARLIASIRSAAAVLAALEAPAPPDSKGV
jgi:hypothetical protein